MSQVQRVVVSGSSGSRPAGVHVRTGTEQQIREIKGLNGVYLTIGSLEPFGVYCTASEHFEVLSLSSGKRLGSSQAQLLVPVAYGNAIRVRGVLLKLCPSQKYPKGGAFFQVAQIGPSS